MKTKCYSAVNGLPEKSSVKNIHAACGRCRQWTLILVSLALSLPCSAVSVMCGDHKLGDITFSNYEVRYGNDTDEHTAPRLDTDTWGGANLNSTFTFDSCPPEMTLRPGLEFRWIQLVWTDSPISDPIRGLPSRGGYVDPWSNPSAPPYGYEDDKPFYWTDDQWVNDWWDPDTDSLSFADRSRRPLGSEVDWEADLNLVCTWDDMIHPLGYVTWGWEMDDENNVTLDPATLEWIGGASPLLESIVNDPTEFDGAWKFTEDCCCVPEVPDGGSTLLLLSLVLSSYGISRSLRCTAA